MAARRRSPWALALLLVAGASPVNAQVFGLGVAPRRTIPLEGGGGPPPVEAARPRTLRQAFAAFRGGLEVPLSQEGEIYAECMRVHLSMGRRQARHLFDFPPLEPRRVSDPDGIRRLLRLWTALYARETGSSFEKGVLATGFLNGTRVIRGRETGGNWRYDRFHLRPPAGREASQQNRYLNDYQRHSYAASFLNNSQGPLGRLISGTDHANPSFLARAMGWKLEEWRAKRILPLSDLLICYLFETYPGDFHVPYLARQGALGASGARVFSRILERKAPGPESYGPALERARGVGSLRSD